MAHKYLATYLNDHLAGASAGVELLERMVKLCAGTDAARTVGEVHREVVEDRQELEDLMGRLGVTRSLPRAASGWLAEKATQLKLLADDPAGKGLRLFEVAEAVSLGIEGKRALWIALAKATQTSPALGKADYDRLIGRAEDQRRRIDEVRVGAATTALAPTP